MTAWECGWYSYIFIAKTQLLERNTFPVDGGNTMYITYITAIVLGKVMRYQDGGVSKFEGIPIRRWFIF